MPRTARIIVPGVPHHVTQRGNNHQRVFFSNDDRMAYLNLLSRYSKKYGLEILSYCLMDNHIHVIGIPTEENSLAQAIGRTHFTFTRRINDLVKRSGHLWQGRFYSCCLDEDHFWRALLYVEQNPVRAGLVDQAWNYPWSSAAAHCGLRDSGGLLDLERWRATIGEQDWADTLLTFPTETELQQLRRSTMSGRPVGDDTFLVKLESVLGRRLRSRPVGRPKK